MCNILNVLLLLHLYLVTQQVETKNVTECSRYSTYNSTLEVCTCPDKVKRLLHCNESGYIDAVKDCACVTYNEDTDEIQFGYCLYGCGRDLNMSYIYRPDGYSFIETDKYKWMKCHEVPVKELAICMVHV